MKYDLVRTENFNRQTGGNVNVSLLRGRITHLMLLCSSGFATGDFLDITLRHKQGVEILQQRVPLLVLSEVTDLKWGIPSFGIPQSPVDFESSTEPATVPVTTYSLNAVLVPVGHLTLADGTANLDVTVTLGTAFGSTAEKLRIYTVSGPMASDHILQFIPSNDLEAQHSLIREIYLYTKNHRSFFNGPGSTGSKPVPRDVQVRYDLEGDSFRIDLDGAGAATSMFSEANEPSSNVLQVMADHEELPSDVYLSVQGSQAAEVTVLLVKEKLIPSLTRVSNKLNLNKQMARVIKLEATAPDQAKAYVEAGQTLPSEKLKAISDAMPNNVLAVPASV